MRFVFEITGMTCTNCSRTVSRAVSKVEGITSYTVCLLTEQLIVEAESIDPEMIVDKVDAVGFDAKYIEEFNVNDGDLTLKVQTEDCEDILNQELNILEGIMSYDITSSEISLKFIPEEISAK